MQMALRPHDSKGSHAALCGMKGAKDGDRCHQGSVHVAGDLASNFRADA